MEAASLVLSVTQTVFAALKCKELREICKLWDCEFELDSLKNTISTIKSVLLDAESKGEFSHQQLNYLQRLKVAVSKADDLLKDFDAQAEHHHQQVVKVGKLPKKVRFLLVCFGELGVTRKMSKKFKMLSKELDAIASDATQFSFKIDHEPIRTRREETCSYILGQSVTGREKETDEIINLILPTDPERDLSIVAIVGMGEVGKTTLAQHVFNQDKVENGFQLRFWVCLSNLNPSLFNVESVLKMILASATGTMQDGSTYDLVQLHLREFLQDKKYLLVLDDVWTGDRNQWLGLKSFLMGGKRGSCILVTTRSEDAARAVGCNTSYNLQGLPDQSSQR